MLFICFLYFYLINTSKSLNTSMYAYIKELCPDNMMTLTGLRHVHTCDEQCPWGSSCIHGICCTRPPSCNHFTYKYPSKYSCLPRVTRNCPEDHKCVPSSREGMHICCRAKPNRVSALSAEKSVCPASHPVISHNRQQLRLCSECQNGVCAPFRKSAVSICCHSFTTLCGPGSTVEMDGLLARDCSNVPCSVGFECSLTPFGDRVCCSLAECSNGQRARAVCAGGCRNDEICEVIQQQRWCCPIVKTITRKCPDNRVSNGAICSPSSPICDDGYKCEESIDQEGYLCCQNGQLSATTLSSWVKTFTNDQTMAATSSTNDPIISVRLHKCHNGANPLMIDGEYLKCPELGAPCPKAGYTCQFGDGGLYCCPLNVIDILEASTVSIFTPPTESSENCRECVPEQPPAPKCPFAFREARSQTSDEFKTCIGLLDFSCPFGFTCLPSSTTPTFLCCAQIKET